MLYCSNSAWNLLQYPKNQTRSYQTLDVLGWDNHHLRPAEFCLGRDFTTGRIRSRHLAKRLGSRGHHGKVIRRKKKNNSFSTFIIILMTFTIHLSWSCTSIIKDVEHMIKICSKTSFTSLPKKKCIKMSASNRLRLAMSADDLVMNSCRHGQVGHKGTKSIQRHGLGSTALHLFWMKISRSDQIYKIWNTCYISKKIHLIWCKQLYKYHMYINIYINIYLHKA